MCMQKEQLTKLISEGEIVLSMNNILPAVEPRFVPKQAYETWMGKINTFNERHLKKHPMYRSIHNCYFFRENKPSKCYEMIGLLKSVESDEEFWHDIIVARINHNKEVDETVKSLKEIFISHRNTDKVVADMIFDFLVSLGVKSETIFCSSLPGNDVRQKISVEVKDALKTSRLNIAILSKEYYKSAYCLNEAGILWFTDTTVLPIALPDIEPNDMIGFLNADNKIRRLDNDTDIAYIADLLADVGILTSTKNTTVVAQGQKLKAKFEKSMESVISIHEPAQLIV